ncbi:MAG: hypothetical protein RBT05_03685 [Bacteroidales bacterium]|jgi:hypothetical protein|nr:hypothetical protein [Bacteroidales bacterium]
MNDKILHALFGFIIAWRCLEIGIYWWLCLIIVIIVGVAKEVYDYKSYGLFDKRDMIATILGGIAFLITEILIL